MAGTAQMKHPSFTCSLAASKEEGENFFRIQGEEGSAWVEGGGRTGAGASGKETQVCNNQPDPSRWNNEMERFAVVSRLPGMEDCLRRQEIALRPMGIMDGLRRSALSVFSDDAAWGL